ncbi:hypothetical protein Q6346_02210 [Isoptericola sp. b490]|uniref:hypothetical protein n=1 Tax=Actinotalea lenta TaxID=3064654 RepID=UPI002713792A|nr:hypothetical protein [Isoptericola sp. b490]MDO8120127.1 hypothetical protein [Isoptericola sp. b490]
MAGGLSVGGVAVALLGAFALHAPSAAEGLVDPAAPPPAVTAALQPGSPTFDTALDLGASDSAGTVDGAARPSDTSVRFGTPHAYFYYWPTPSDSPTFTDTDVDRDRGRTWLSVEFVDGVATQVLEVDDVGRLGSLGDWSFGDPRVLDALPADALVLTDGRFGEAYWVSADRTTVTALGGEASRLIGTATDPRTFRTLKAAQEARADTEWQAGNPAPDASGGTGGGADSPAVILLEVVGGAVLLVLVGYLLARPRRRSVAGRTASGGRDTEG